MCLCDMLWVSGWKYREIENKGSDTAGSPAQLCGTAAVEESELKLNDKVYSKAGNHVLKLSGGSKGSSYVSLPSDMYKGCSSKNGITWSFWMKTEENVVSYSRVFSSTDSSNGNELAFAPFAIDKVWNLIFDDGDTYRQIFSTEPEKGIWNYITISISDKGSALFVNGETKASSRLSGSTATLKTDWTACHS